MRPENKSSSNSKQIHPKSQILLFLSLSLRWIRTRFQIQTTIPPLQSMMSDKPGKNRWKTQTAGKLEEISLFFGSCKLEFMLNYE